MHDAAGNPKGKSNRQRRPGGGGGGAHPTPASRSPSVNAPTNSWMPPLPAGQLVGQIEGPLDAKRLSLVQATHLDDRRRCKRHSWEFCQAIGGQQAAAAAV